MPLCVAVCRPFPLMSFRPVGCVVCSEDSLSERDNSIEYGERAIAWGQPEQVGEMATRGLATKATTTRCPESIVTSLSVVDDRFCEL